MPSTVSTWVARNPFRASMLGWAAITAVGFSALWLVRRDMDVARRREYREQMERDNVARN
ncbi:hypothetical protein HDU82_000465, partial [Entophlyctis luteolus]